MKGLLNAKMSFYETNPSGRILNRMNGDVSRLERKAPGTFAYLFGYIIVFLSSTAIICITTPYLIVLFFICLSFSFPFFRKFQAAFIDSNRLLPLTQSQISSHIDETLEGMVTVKAFRLEGRFTLKMDLLIDQFVSTEFVVGNLANWLKARIIIMTSLISLGIALLACRTTAVASFVGVALISASAIQQSLTFAVINVTNMEGHVRLFVLKLTVFLDECY